MTRRLAGLLLLISISASGCFVPDDAQPTVGLSGELASKFVHRGMTQVDRPVVQPRLRVNLPTTSGDTIGFTAGGNVDLSNSTGDAWFPDGHAGRFTEIDFVADYERQLNDTFRIRAGIFNYNLPNGLEFPNGERGATTEIFATLSANVLDATPYVSWHYDFDEVRGAYYRGGITEGFELAENVVLTLDGSIGYVSGQQGSWLYGLDEAGFADLRGSATVAWQVDGRTQLTGGVHGSLIVDSTIDEWFALINIDDDPIWFTLGVNWLF
ncbi:MAG: hypothetical protein AB8H80_01660 [Planctomycetota bacterium]